MWAAESDFLDCEGFADPSLDLLSRLESAAWPFLPWDLEDCRAGAFLDWEFSLLAPEAPAIFEPDFPSSTCLEAFFMDPFLEFLLLPFSDLRFFDSALSGWEVACSASSLFFEFDLEAFFKSGLLDLESNLCLELEPVLETLPDLAFSGSIFFDWDLMAGSLDLELFLLEAGLLPSPACSGLMMEWFSLLPLSFLFDECTVISFSSLSFFVFIADPCFDLEDMWKLRNKYI